MNRTGHAHTDTQTHTRTHAHRYTDTHTHARTQIRTHLLAHIIYQKKRLLSGVLSDVCRQTRHVCCLLNKYQNIDVCTKMAERLESVL